MSCALRTHDKSTWLRLYRKRFLQQGHIRQQHLKHITKAPIHAWNQNSVLPQLLTLNQLYPTGHGWGTIAPNLSRFIHCISSHNPHTLDISNQKHMMSCFQREPNMYGCTSSGLFSPSSALSFLILSMLIPLYFFTSSHLQFLVSSHYLRRGKLLISDQGILTWLCC